MAMEGADKNNFDKCGDELMSRELMERDTGRADDGQMTLRQRPLARCGQSDLFAPPELRQR